jgi:ubiquinone/menaquinone biosynthesis C-methylase UbiE
MGLFRKFVNNTRKPEGLLGALMLSGMNREHAKMADWGMGKFPPMTPHSMLDIGCGGGRNAAVLMRKYPKAVMTAMDYSPLSVEKAKKFNQNAIAQHRCEVLEGNVSAMPFADESFDLATAFETIYFWPGLTRCFKEVRRVLKPGGRFCIVCESDGTDAVSRKYEKIIEGMKSYTVSEIQMALQDADFSDIQSFHHGSNPWIVVIAAK